MLLDRLGPSELRFNDFGPPRFPYLSPLARARALMARPWFARCYGVARQREGSRQNGIGAPAFTLSITLSAREGAAGQAVVCPLLRGSSPTRGVAPKRHQGLRRAFSPAFRAGSLYPLARGCRRSRRGEVCNYGLWLRRRRARGCRRIWRGEGWFRPARCCSTGSGRLNLDLLISGPRVYLIYHPYARGRCW